jgi:hypothetical protein
MAMVMKDIQMAKSLYEQGATWKEISKELGEDDATIWYYMRKSGVHFDRKIPLITREEVDKIAHLYRKGQRDRQGGRASSENGGKSIKKPRFKEDDPY